MFYSEHSLVPRPICSKIARLKAKEKIMNKREIVQDLLDSVQKGDFEKAKSLLTDDFQFSGPIPQPINREAWLGMSASLKTAFPNLDYHFNVIGAQGDVVKTTSQLSGTHTGSFDLTAMKRGMTVGSSETCAAYVRLECAICAYELMLLRFQSVSKEP